MKIRQEHFDHMKREIDRKAEELGGWPVLVEKYETGRFNNADKVKNLQMRFCFDMSYFAIPSKWICDELYPYVNDDHIFTALKAICPNVTKRY